MGAERSNTKPSPALVLRRTAALLSLLLLPLAACRPAAPQSGSADVVEYLSSRTGGAGFARATGPRPIRFPADEGPHPEYQTEWWYYTGNLAAVDAGGANDGDRGAAGSGGRRFGFQLTFFRRALAPASAAADRASDWGAGQIYLAHFAVTDAAADRFHSAERLARGGAGLAGAVADPFRVWVESWSIAPHAGVDVATTNEGDFDVADLDIADIAPIRLVAADGPVAIDLVLRPAKPPALHGDRGYSRKGPEPGNASYYYSYTRLASEGTVTTADGTFAVAGQSWMDHEWSTSALSASQVGWDWFSLQLGDGRDLMLFQLREDGGGIAPESGGSVVGADGAVATLVAGDFGIAPLDRWTSPRTGAEYPSGWQVTVPSAGLDLVVEPLVRDQELDVGFKYWEGAVRISGTAGRAAASGYGYVELTGYAPDATGRGLPGAD